MKLMLIWVYAAFHPYAPFRYALCKADQKRGFVMLSEILCTICGGRRLGDMEVDLKSARRAVCAHGVDAHCGGLRAAEDRRSSWVLLPRTGMAHRRVLLTGF